MDTRQTRRDRVFNVESINTHLTNLGLFQTLPYFLGALGCVIVSTFFRSR